MHKDKRMNTTRIALDGFFAAIAIIFGYVETLLPVFAGIPGIKLGLANLSVLFILKRYTFFDALVVSMIRILVISFWFGTGAFSFLYSLAGASLSLIVMTLLLRKTRLSLYGVSVAGGISHNIAQLIIASVIVHNSMVMYYTPVLLISGVITGLMIGYLTAQVSARVKNYK